MPTRVAVAMSGGVDSSVTVTLLKEQGYEVIGLHMKLNDRPPSERVNKSCCSLDEALDARAVCGRLGVPFYVLDFQQEFKSTVIDYFVDEYQKGRTPNPCVMCNKKIKSAYLLQKADELDCEFLATGHYARVVTDEQTGRRQIARAKDRSKDQTYFLYGTPHEEVQRLMFPLGELEKSEVREIAARWQLPSAFKPDSQGICFVDRDYRDVLKQHLDSEPEPGDFVDLSGRVLGRHNGLPFYTVGQRRGLGLSDETPWFVLRLDKGKNQVVLGKKADTCSDLVEVSAPNWVSMDPPREPFEAMVKLRYAHPGVMTRVIPLSHGNLRLELQEPVRSIAPGQAAVFYDGEILLGGGWIERCIDSSEQEGVKQDQSEVEGI